MFLQKRNPKIEKKVKKHVKFPKRGRKVKKASYTQLVITQKFIKKNFEGVSIVDLSKRSIKEIKGDAFNEDVLELNLKGNFIKDVIFMNSLKNLKKLNLSSNRIKEMRLKTTHKTVVSLNMSFNKIKNCKFLFRFPNLEKLFLGGCHIKELNEELFLLKNLIRLKLSQNRIKFLPKKFEKLRKLKELELDGNSLEYVEDFRAFRKIKLSKLKLKNNPVVKNIRTRDKIFDLFREVKHFDVRNKRSNDGGLQESFKKRSKKEVVIEKLDEPDFYSRMRKTDGDVKVVEFANYKKERMVRKEERYSGTERGSNLELKKNDKKNFFEILYKNEEKTNKW